MSTLFLSLQLHNCFLSILPAFGPLSNILRFHSIWIFTFMNCNWFKILSNITNRNTIYLIQNSISRSSANVFVLRRVCSLVTHPSTTVLTFVSSTQEHGSIIVLISPDMIHLNKSNREPHDFQLCFYHVYCTRLLPDK